LAFPEAGERLKIDKEKIAMMGNPIRKDLLTKQKEGAVEFLNLEKGIPTILILGGSSGSQIINESVVDILQDLVKNYQIIHQIGRSSYEELKNRAAVALHKNEYEDRYKPFPYLNTLAMRMSVGNLLI